MTTVPPANRPAPHPQVSPPATFEPTADERRLMTRGGRAAVPLIRNELHHGLSEDESRRRGEALIAWWEAWVSGPEPVLPMWIAERPDVD